MTRPQRIQRKRAQGWRMSANTVYVAGPQNGVISTPSPILASRAPLERLSATCGPPWKVWLKSKNPASEAVRREREEEWR
jgi:hypothetical protein